MPVQLAAVWNTDWNSTGSSADFHSHCTSIPLAQCGGPRARGARRSTPAWIAFSIESTVANEIASSRVRHRRPSRYSELCFPSYTVAWPPCTLLTLERWCTDTVTYPPPTARALVSIVATAVKLAGLHLQPSREPREHSLNLCYSQVATGFLTTVPNTNTVRFSPAKGGNKFCVITLHHS